jgi:hypothetical protein
MKICPKCNDSHNKPGTYCCRSCANGRVWGQEQRDKKSATLLATYATKDNAYFKDRTAKGLVARSSTVIKQLLETDFSKLGHHARRRRVLIEQDYKCNKCGLTTWLDEPISLEMDHIDGNNKNNDRGNLECLCPNCYAQTPTWRGRNRIIPA